MNRLGSNVGCFDAGADQTPRCRPGGAGGSPPPWPPSCRSTRAPRGRPAPISAPAPTAGTSRARPGRCTSSAPRSAASFLRRSPGSTTVIGPMPRATRAAIESAPIGPAPMTITLSPGPTPERVMPWSATASRLGQRGLACRRDPVGAAAGRRRAPARSGRRPRCGRRSSTLTVLALRRLPLEAPPAPPALGRGAAHHRLADPQPCTPSPRAATEPVNSWPATRPGLLPQPSSSMWMSEPQMPQWSTSTSTSPGPGRGTGRSSTTTSPGRR